MAALEMDDVLTELDGGQPAPLYLLVGEEFLVRKGADDLVRALLPDAAVGLNLSVMDGASPREVAQELATLPLFPGRKVVVLRDPEFLAPKKGRTDGLSRAREAWKAGRRKEGARRLLALAARAGWGVAELDAAAPGAPGPSKWKEELDVELAEADLAFLSEVAAFCVEERITVPEGDTTPLLELLDRGLPQGHVLVMACSEVDAKNPLVKRAGAEGRRVDRKVAARLKDLDVGDVVAELLAPHGKRLGTGAMEALKDRIGGNMRLWQSELEKLAVYAEGSVISADDVRLLVGRVRDEEFMELSDALQKRDLAAALRYVQDALGQGTHALQLLGSVASIVRTLLLNQERLARMHPGPFRMSFNDFKSKLFPQIEREAKGSKGRPPHPFAVYMAMQAAARYGRAELLDALRGCAEADLALKSSGSGRLVMEGLLFRICGRETLTARWT
jgi:DNA polymerase III subunit delta